MVAGEPRVGRARRAARSVARPAATASGLPDSVPGLVDVARRARCAPSASRAAAVGGGGQAAADDLAHDRQVGQ